MKKKLSAVLVVLAMLSPLYAQQKTMLQKGTEEKINRLLSEMTLDEKIGQLNLVASWGFRSALKGNTQSENLNLVHKGLLGAFYGFKNVDEMTQLQKMAVNESRHGIPFFFGMDCIHGLETTFPIPLALASSWDTTLVKQTAVAAAREAKALGINWVFSPMVDICRDARWGRVAESNGEDPYLGGCMARAYVEGYQSEDVMACVKHFALYGAAEAGRDYNTVTMDRQEMMNGFMRPYQEAVRAGAASFMSSFNEFEGIPATCNRYLLTDLLRKRFGFKGFIVTDATAIADLQQHGLGNLQEVSARALKAGIDMDMNSNGFVGTLRKSVKEGLVTVADIDSACKRILEAKFKMGLMDNPYRFLNKTDSAKTVYTKANRELALRAARECAVLLKNDGILPLRKDMRIALVGPLADNAEDMQGCWSVSSHKKESVTILQGIKEKLKGGQVECATGSWLVADSALESTLTTDLLGFYLHGLKPQPVHQKPLEQMIDEAVRLAQNADVVIAALGENNAMNGEGASRSDITIPEPQRQLLRALKQTGKPIVLLVTTGRPLVLAEENQQVNAMLCTWALGDQAGRAIADLLFGDANPSGKLTMSFPRSVGQCPIYYNHKNTGRPHPDDAPYKKFTSCYLDVPNSPLFPFGYGLSYTQFKYSPISLSSDSMNTDGHLTASVNVTNTGKRDGDEIVQLYIHDVAASSTRPVKELKHFARVHLKAGETQQVSFNLTAEDLKFYNHDLQYVSEPGLFEIMIGPNSRDIQKQTFKLY
jgi:beta-glucosidase